MKPKQAEPARTPSDPGLQLLRSDKHFARLPSVLWDARRRLNLTQTQMGRRLGVRASTLAKWEQGEERPRGRHITLLAELTGIDIVTLRLLAAGFAVDRLFRRGVRGVRTVEHLQRLAVDWVEREAEDQHGS